MNAFDVGQIAGAAVLALGVGAVAGYLSKKYWVAAVLATATCFVSIAPLEQRMASAGLCIAIIWALSAVKKSKAS